MTMRMYGSLTAYYADYRWVSFRDMTLLPYLITYSTIFTFFLNYSLDCVRTVEHLISNY